MSRALICHGPGDYEEIDLSDATSEIEALAIRTPAELELVEMIMQLENNNELE